MSREETLALHGLSDHATPSDTRSLTFRSLRHQNACRNQESFRGDVYGPSDWAVAIAEECGEVAQIAKRIRDGKLSAGEAKQAMADELADVVTYVDLMAHHFGIDLGDAVRDKFNRVSQRPGVNSERRL